MKSLRIHILGASGSGVSTLGRALAQKTNAAFFDSDDFFWESTNPPFTKKRAVEERRELLEKSASQSPQWILSGSAVGWGNFLKPLFSHVIFLSLPAEIRMSRIRARETERYGTRIAPGGDMHQQSLDFLAWAARYDLGGMDVRSLALHEAWMRSLPCPLLRLSSLESLEVLVSQSLAFFARSRPEVRIEESASIPDRLEAFFQRHRLYLQAKDGDRFFLALQGSEILGAAQLSTEANLPLLKELLVAEHFRRLGVGRALLQSIDAYWKRHKITGAHLLTHDHLTTFFGGIGFKRIPEQKAPSFLAERTQKAREEGMADAIVMRRA